MGLVVLIVIISVVLFIIFNKYMKYKNINEDNLIYEETVSPNEYYVSSDEEKVFYTIKIYK